MKPTWIVEDSDKIGDLTDLCKAIEESGSKLIRTKYAIINQEIWNEIESTPRPVLAYGTINFINVFRQLKCSAYPLYYADKRKYDITRYAHILGEEYLNYNYTIYALRDLIKRNPFSGSFFIRPIGGYKDFAGYVIEPNDYEREIKSLVSATMSYEDPLVLTAPLVDIKQEFRFVIASNLAVTGSLYIPEEEPIPDDHPAYSYAGKIASYLAKDNVFWQPETAYTLDIADINGEFKVVEINSFSCAGLYACDKKKLVEALNKTMKKDFLEEMGNRFVDWQDSLIEEK